MESHLADRRQDPGIIGAVEPRLYRVEADRSGLHLTDQDEIVPPLIRNVVAPDRAVWKHVEERRELALHRRRIAVVDRQPLRDDAARVQMRLDQLVVLLRI